MTASGSLSDALWQALSHNPEETALWASDGEAVCRRTLVRRADQQAQALRAQGVRPGDSVALILDNEPAFVIAALAVWRLGAVLVPLNPRLSPAEIAIVAHDAGVRLVIDRNGLTCATSPPDGEREGLDPDIAALVYTSGTTGRPKGVMLSHDNLLADARANVAVLRASSEDRFAALSPLSHVFGMVNVLLSGLLCGAPIALAPAFSPRRALRAVTRHGVSVVIAVPTMYQAMAQAMMAFNARNERAVSSFASVRVCHSGAAAMPIPLIDRIEQLFGAPVQEGYGLSEATSIVCSNPLAGPRKPGFVGPAIPGVRVRVMREDGQEAGVGETGELQVFGPTVMRGYYRRRQETAAALTADGWLRAGDLAWRDADGYAAIAGRLDDLIIVGGLKTYPREIEEALLAHPAVADVAVAGVADQAEMSRTHQRVHAWIRPTPGANPEALTPGALAAFCAERLAAYKIPTRWHVSSAPLPQGPSGKILRRRLRECAQTAGDSANLV